MSWVWNCIKVCKPDCLAVAVVTVTRHSSLVPRLFLCPVLDCLQYMQNQRGESFNCKWMVSPRKGLHGSGGYGIKHLMIDQCVWLVIKLNLAVVQIRTDSFCLHAYWLRAGKVCLRCGSRAEDNTVILMILKAAKQHVRQCIPHNILQLAKLTSHQ